MKETSENLDLYKTSYKCDKCKDLGIILDENNKAKAYCECYIKDRIETMSKKSNMKFKHFTFKNFDDSRSEYSKKLKDVATKYYKEFNQVKDKRSNSIAFLGQPGSGKTHIAGALANNLFQKRNVFVLYVEYIELSTMYKQRFNNIEYQSTIDKSKKADVLFIDDLLKCKPTESDRELLMNIVNHRYINNLPMIISSENTIDDIRRFDEALGGRIYEMCKNYIVEIERDIKLDNRLK